MNDDELSSLLNVEYYALKLIKQAASATHECFYWQGSTEHIVYFPFQRSRHRSLFVNSNKNAFTVCSVCAHINIICGRFHCVRSFISRYIVYIFFVIILGSLETHNQRENSIRFVTTFQRERKKRRRIFSSISDCVLLLSLDIFWLRIASIFISHSSTFIAFSAGEEKKTAHFQRNRNPFHFSVWLYDFSRGGLSCSFAYAFAGCKFRILFGIKVNRFVGLLSIQTTRDHLVV